MLPKSPAGLERFMTLHPVDTLELGEITSNKRQWGERERFWKMRGCAPEVECSDAVYKHFQIRAEWLKLQ